MNKTLLTYGIISGAICTLLFLGPFALNPDQYMDPDNYAMGEVYGYSVMVLSMLPIFFGTRAYRNKFHTGEFGFGQAFWTALKITFFSTIIFYIGNVIVYEVIVPDFLGTFSESYHEYMMDAAETEEERQKIMKTYEAQAGFISNSYGYAGLMAVTILFIGLIISLISALALRKPATA